MFGNTDSLNEHLKYTTTEWSSSEYYKKVQEYLTKVGIKNFIDIGSCSGGVSDLLFDAIPSLQKAILVEPMPENFEFINNRIQNDDRRNVINKALFYGEDFVQLGKVRSNVGGWSYQSSEFTTKVKTITLEKIIEEYKTFFNGDIDFVKIDIEGAEYNLIQNSEVLKTIPYLEIEFHPNDEYGINYQNNSYLNDTWGIFVQKYLPNHTLIYGGKNEKFLWPNGEQVIYDGSGFFVLTELLK